MMMVHSSLYHFDAIIHAQLYHHHYIIRRGCKVMQHGIGVGMYGMMYRYETNHSNHVFHAHAIIMLIYHL